MRHWPRLVGLVATLAVSGALGWWMRSIPPPAPLPERPLRVIDSPSPRMPWLGARPGAGGPDLAAPPPPIDRARSLPQAETVPPTRPRPPAPAEPLPALPLPGRPPDPDLLRRATGALEARRTLSLGPYAATTDVEDVRLLSMLAAVAGAVEKTYAARYGVVPVGEPREHVVLYRDEAAYRRLSTEDERIASIASAGYTVSGLVLLYAGERPPTEVATTLVHELTHLLNRRALGPALPPWLDEGIAEDLAQSRITPSGELVPGALGGLAYDRRDHVELRGGLAALLVLQRAVGSGEAPRVEDLVSSPWAEFVAAGREQRYDAACFFVRYLLEGEGGALAPAFHGFLRGIAAGESPDGEELRRRLDRPWPLLDLGWHAWLSGIDVRAAAAEARAE